MIVGYHPTLTMGKDAPWVCGGEKKENKKLYGLQ